MITMLEVLNERGETLHLPLEDYSEGYLLQSIDGLAPVKASIATSNFARIDGVQFQSSRREGRNIVISIGLEADYVSTTVEGLRNALYSFFMTESPTTLKFHVDGVPKYEITGIVETFETEHFSKEPSVTISILCFQPDFLDVEETLVSGVTSSAPVETILNYTGSVPTGVLVTLNVNVENLIDFTLHNRQTNGVTQRFEFVGQLEVGDEVLINSVPGDKRATRIRNAVESSVLYGVSPASKWIQLTPGENALRVQTGYSGIPYTIKYKQRYGGL